MHFTVSSAICSNLDQSKILLSRNGLTKLLFAPAFYFCVLLGNSSSPGKRANHNYTGSGNHSSSGNHSNNSNQERTSRANPKDKSEVSNTIYSLLHSHDF